MSADLSRKPGWVRTILPVILLVTVSQTQIHLLETNEVSKWYSLDPH